MAQEHEHTDNRDPTHQNKDHNRFNRRGDHSDDPKYDRNPAKPARQDTGAGDGEPVREQEHPYASEESVEGVVLERVQRLPAAGWILLGTSAAAKINVAAITATAANTSERERRWERRAAAKKSLKTTQYR